MSKIHYYSICHEHHDLFKKLASERQLNVSNNKNQSILLDGVLEALLAPWFKLTHLFDPMWIQIQADLDPIKAIVYMLFKSIKNQESSKTSPCDDLVVDRMEIKPGCFEISPIQVYQHSFFDQNQDHVHLPWDKKSLWYWLVQEIWYSVPMDECFKSYWIEWTWSRLSKDVLNTLDQIISIIPINDDQTFIQVKHKSMIMAIPYSANLIKAWMPKNIKPYINKNLNCHYNGYGAAFWDAIRLDHIQSNRFESHLSQKLSIYIKDVYQHSFDHKMDENVMSSLITMIEPYRVHVMAAKRDESLDIDHRLLSLGNCSDAVRFICNYFHHISKSNHSQLSYDHKNNRKTIHEPQMFMGRRIAHPRLNTFVNDKARVKYHSAHQLEIVGSQYKEYHIHHRIVQFLTAPLLMDMFNVCLEDHLLFSIWLYQNLPSHLADMIDQIAEDLEEKIQCLTKK